MRIAVVCQPTDLVGEGVAMGSVAIQSLELAEQLARRHDVALFARRGPGQKRRERLGDRLTVRRFRVAKRTNRVIESLAGLILPRRRFFASRRYYAHYFQHVAEAIAEDTYDVVHFQSYFQHAPLLRQHCGSAVLGLHMHSQWLDQLHPGRVRPALEACDLAFGCSRFVTDSIAARFPEHADRCHELLNGVDTDLFCPDTDATRDPRAPGPPRLLYVGRISPEKGLHVLIDAWPAIDAACPGVTLDLVGQPGLLPFNVLVGLSNDPQIRSLRRFYGVDGIGSVYRQLLRSKRSYIDDLNDQMQSMPEAMRSRIRFRGPLPHHRLAEQYRQADLLVLPSFYETFGVPVIESMACGTPVVASGVGGVAELIEPGESGMLVPPNDAPALADAVIELLRDPARRTAMGQHASQLARHQFGWSQLARRVETHYAQALAARATKEQGA